MVQVASPKQHPCFVSWKKSVLKFLFSSPPTRPPPSQKRRRIASPSDEVIPQLDGATGEDLLSSATSTPTSLSPPPLPEGRPATTPTARRLLALTYLESGAGDAGGELSPPPPPEPQPPPAPPPEPLRTTQPTTLPTLPEPQSPTPPIAATSLHTPTAHPELQKASHSSHTQTACEENESEVSESYMEVVSTSAPPQAFKPPPTPPPITWRLPKNPYYVICKDCCSNTHYISYRHCRSCHEK